ncbi:MAG: hypothetical protein V5A43_07590 [Haloarculaceae archaeon]
MVTSFSNGTADANGQNALTSNSNDDVTAFVNSQNALTSRSNGDLLPPPDSQNALTSLAVAVADILASLG